MGGMPTLLALDDYILSTIISGIFAIIAVIVSALLTWKLQQHKAAKRALKAENNRLKARLGEVQEVDGGYEQTSL
jgi:uncharacterized membrane protein YciS (DUF1049 family)